MAVGLALLVISIPLTGIPQPYRIAEAKAVVRIVRMAEVDFSKAKPRQTAKGAPKRIIVDFE